MSRAHRPQSASERKNPLLIVITIDGSIIDLQKVC